METTMAGDYGMPPAPAAKSGGVVAVAVMAFVVAGLDLICGVLFFCAGGLLTGVSGASGEFREKLDAEMRKQGKSLDAPDVAPVLKAVGTILMVASVVRVLFAGALIPAGVGLIGRKSWGRTLSLILAVIAGVLALSGIVLTFMGGGIPLLLWALVEGAFAVLAFIFLLKPEVAAEFS
jgi:hypothetical protein